jgi:hypothetical protein
MMRLECFLDALSSTPVSCQMFPSNFHGLAKLLTAVCGGSKVCHRPENDLFADTGFGMSLLVAQPSVLHGLLTTQPVAYLVKQSTRVGAMARLSAAGLDHPGIARR